MCARIWLIIVGTPGKFASLPGRGVTTTRGDRQAGGSGYVACERNRIALITSIRPIVDAYADCSFVGALFSARIDIRGVLFGPFETGRFCTLLI
jgi:hypothetical protein